MLSLMKRRNRTPGRQSHEQAGGVTPAGFLAAKISLEIKRRIVDHFLHDKEGARLPHARQREQLFAVQLSEIGDVLDADLEKEIEVAGDQVAIEHKRQFPDRRLEG
jgi:hypothetical protein